MLAQLRMVYPSGSIKHHIIGIVPVVNGNEIHMHIVEECQPKRKMIPLNEENLIWCSGECKSYSVDQLVAFVLGEKAVKKLKDHTSDHTIRCIKNLLTFEKHYQN
jgi:hypothetical protein